MSLGFTEAVIIRMILKFRQQIWQRYPTTFCIVHDIENVGNEKVRNARILQNSNLRKWKTEIKQNNWESLSTCPLEGLSDLAINLPE